MDCTCISFFQVNAVLNSILLLVNNCEQGAAFSPFTFTYKISWKN
jgi:hypothetical protein